MSTAARKKKPFMPLYPADYFEDTFTLEPEEHGVYCVLIFTAWQRDGVLPGNLNDLRLLIGTKMPKLHGNRFNKLVLPILERFFFTDSEGNHRHKRVEKELETAEKLSRKQKENVEKRYSVSNENNDVASEVVGGLVVPRAPVLQSQSQSHIELEANDESIPHPASPTAVVDPAPTEPELFGEGSPPEPAKPKTIKIKDAFEQFYTAYPLKKERAAAFKAFEKAMKSGQVTFSKLLAGVEDYKRFTAPDTPWKYPATWLNKGCWADEYEAAPRAAPVLPFRSPRAPTAIDQRTDFKNFIAGKVAKHFGGPEPPREPFNVTDQAIVIEH